MKILIVDDVLMVGRQLKHILEREELFQVEVTDRPREALWKLQHDPYIRVVITDLLMPDINGLDFVKEARQIARVGDQGESKVPEFILMTAVEKDTQINSSDRVLLLNAVNSGLFADVLHKPICRDRLLESVFDLDLDEAVLWESVDSQTKENPVITRLQKKIDGLITTNNFVTLEALEQMLERNLNDLKEKLNSL